MKLLLRLSVLALAAVGAKALYDRFQPRVAAVGDTGAHIGDTIKPAFREAATSVRNASTHAVHEVTDATQQVVDDLKTAADPTADPSPAAPGGAADDAAAVDRSFGGREPLSAMAARDLGIEDGDRP